MTTPQSSTFDPVIYRTYSRKKPTSTNGHREKSNEILDRALNGITQISKNISRNEKADIETLVQDYTLLPSGRWLWVGGTEWNNKPTNYYGAYNCCGLMCDDLSIFSINFDLLMQGCGVGTCVSEEAISKLPQIFNKLNVKVIQSETEVSPGLLEHTYVDRKENYITIVVGDSREGWVDAYTALFDLATEVSEEFIEFNIEVDLFYVRGKGTPIKGFGGTANPSYLGALFEQTARILSEAAGRQLTSVECCLLLGEAGKCAVAGNVRRSARINQGDAEDVGFTESKDNLWMQTADGSWAIDSKRDALRMANHTRVYHHKPTLSEIEDAVRKQFYSGEGAIQYAPEGIARSNADLLSTPELKQKFLTAYCESKEAAETVLRDIQPSIDLREMTHRMGRYCMNPCGEILGNNFLCNLSEVHLKQLDPLDLDVQYTAFYSAGLLVGSLLHHEFPDELFRYSREVDPIVGVSFTGLFDFFVIALGREWLTWWQAGRPKIYHSDELGELEKFKNVYSLSPIIEKHITDSGVNLAAIFSELEIYYLDLWKVAAKDGVTTYCNRNELKVPNRYTTVQPAGCLTKEALRIFDQGLFLADEHMLENGGVTDLTSEKLTVRKGVPCKSGIANGELDLIRITLKNGRQLTMTPDHRIWFRHGWRRADEINTSLLVKSYLGNYKNTYKEELLPFEIPEGSDIYYPVRMSENLSYLVAVLLCSAKIDRTTYEITFRHRHVAVLEAVVNLLEELFGVVEEFSISEANVYKYLKIKNELLFKWLDAHGFIVADKKLELDRIPLYIRKSSKDCLLAFFTGVIDTNGAITNANRCWIETASEVFIRHLQQVGEAIGLVWNICSVKKQDYRSEKDPAAGIWKLALLTSISDIRSVNYLNRHSIKAQKHSIAFGFDPLFSKDYFRVMKIEKVRGYTYDYEIEGVDDDDSWYYQGSIKSHNTKSLLTNSSPGWHPPKAAQYIRRITMAAHDPVALACIDYGYNVIPSQSCKDEDGKLLDDPYDSRVFEWLIEIPVQTNWAAIANEAQIDISKFSVAAQFDFYMNVQKYYTTHNTSATLEIRADEIESFSKILHDSIAADEGFMSAAMLARFDNLETFPRLPFEPITAEKYLELSEQVLSRRIEPDFYTALSKYDEAIFSSGRSDLIVGPAGCDSDFCETKK